jgi:DNA-binding XRE family transcriptional regulator
MSQNFVFIIENDYICVMKNTNLIYGLRDPRNDVYRYIGKTTIGEKRPLSHLIKSHNSLVNEWVLELKKLSIEPFVDIIEKDIPLEELSAREKYYISSYQGTYGQLLNGGKHLIDTISKPSCLSSDDINLLELALSNTKEIYKMYKTQTSFTDDVMADTLNVGRKTIYYIRRGSIRTCIETIYKMVLLIQQGTEAVFSHYKSNCVDDSVINYDEFMDKCTSNSVFCREWFDSFYQHHKLNNQL